MPLIYDLVTAENIVGYYNSAQEGVDASIGEKLFPARKQIGLTLQQVKAANGQNVVLKPSAFDTEATLRNRVALELNNKKMPFFKEGMLIDEEDRQQLLLVSATKNQNLIDTALANIYDDQTALVKSANTQLELMRMQVLATGKIAISANGINQDFDYGVTDKHKGSVTTAWSDPDSDPLGDIDDAVTKLKQTGVLPGIIVLNSKTLAQIKNNKNTSAAISGVQNNRVTNKRLSDFLADEYGLTVVEQNGVYVDVAGSSHQLFPDGYVTLAPNDAQGLGRTVFGTTPEEADLWDSSEANVELINDGIAVTTTKNTDPVSVLTKVSMIALPSFEGANKVYQLQTTPSV